VALNSWRLERRTAWGPSCVLLRCHATIFQESVQMRKEKHLIFLIMVHRFSPNCSPMEILKWLAIRSVRRQCLNVENERKEDFRPLHLCLIGNDVDDPATSGTTQNFRGGRWAPVATTWNSLTASSVISNGLRVTNDLLAQKESIIIIATIQTDV